MGCGSSSISKEAVIESTPVTILNPSKAQLNVPMNRNANGDLQPRLSVADIASLSQRASIATDFSANDDQQLQYICDTDVSLEWLYQRLTEKFKCTEEPEPQWIAERLNAIGDKDLDQTTVLRVTFGWENENLPKSVVLKICVQQQDDATDEQKLASRMFRRECSVYEWLSKHKKIPAPKIFVLKKQATEAGNGVIIMEDLSEKAIVGDLTVGLNVEAVRDLLKNLAQIHALSLKSTDWTTMIAENSPFFYRQTAEFAANVLKNKEYFDESKLQMLNRFLSPTYMSNVVSESCEDMKISQCLIHGNPVANSVFLVNKEKVTAILDWTQSHPGCYGEDVAKAICWNLSADERHENLLRLLEYYHFNLLKYYGSTLEEITLEHVKKAYHTFLPIATVSFLLFLPEDLEQAEKNLLDRAQSLINDTVVMSTHMDIAEKSNERTSTPLPAET
uniref:CHK kinase-like domain-containing protein n=1 Tax=Panagrolaimus davidi TaxID=227884 RepID=A0A914QM76_9BILA